MDQLPAPDDPEFDKAFFATFDEAFMTEFLAKHNLDSIY